MDFAKETQALIDQEIEEIAKKHGVPREELMRHAISTLNDLRNVGDMQCHECGDHNPIWFAPHDIWNRVVGGPDATDDPGGVLCPNCFLKKAGAVFPNTVWKLTTTDQP